MQSSLRRNTAALSILLLFLAACSGGSGESSDAFATVQEFYGHLNAGRYEQAADLYDDEVRAALVTPDGDLSEGLGEWAREETHDGTITETHLLEAREDAGATEVRFEIRYQDGTKATRTVKVSAKGGGMRLGFISNG